MLNHTPELELINSKLPSSFYEGLPLLQRIEFMIHQWNRCIKVNHQLEEELSQAQSRIKALEDGLQQIKDKEKKNV